MKEYYSEITNKYLPEIQVSLELNHETPVLKFVGTWIGYGARLTGLFVLAENNLYFRGKPKVTFSSSTMSIITSGTKSKDVFIVPLNSIYELKLKKDQVVLKHTLDFRGGKYVGKKAKVILALYQGKEGKEKESKAEWLQRAAEVNAFIEARKGKPLK